MCLKTSFLILSLRGQVNYVKITPSIYVWIYWLLNYAIIYAEPIHRHLSLDPHNNPLKKDGAIIMMVIVPMSKLRLKILMDFPPNHLCQNLNLIPVSRSHLTANSICAFHHFWATNLSHDKSQNRISSYLAEYISVSVISSFIWFSGYICAWAGDGKGEEERTKVRSRATVLKVGGKAS